MCRSKKGRTEMPTSTPPNWSRAWLGVALAAEPGPSGDMAAVGRSEGAEDLGMNPKLRSPAKLRNFGLLRRQLLMTVGRTGTDDAATLPTEAQADCACCVVVKLAENILRESSKQWSPLTWDLGRQTERSVGGRQAWPRLL